MIESKANLSSNGRFNQFAQAQQPYGVITMSATEHTEYSSKPLRILVPINADEESRWGVQYAVHRHLEGINLEVVLLNIGESITQWQVLRFRTQQEISQFQSERAQIFIEDVCQQLAAENIPCRGIFKQGDIVFSILDTAEELGCDEITMPSQKQGVSPLFSRDIVSQVKRQQRAIPVVLVNSSGIPL